MTKTAEQLWWDKEFIARRIKEQLVYIELRMLSKWVPRDTEVLASADYILKRLQKQLEKIKQLK